MRKLLVLLVTILLAFTLMMGIICVSAEGSNEFYFSDESCEVTFTLLDDSKYRAIATKNEDVIECSGDYAWEGNQIVFYLSGMELLRAEATEGNILVEVDSLAEIDNELSEVEKYVTQFWEYVIAGLMGLFGTTGVAILFRKQLTDLITNVGNAISNLKANKEVSDEELKVIKESALSTIASLQNVKQEMEDKYKEEREAILKELRTYREAFLMIASGSKEYVANGTAESIGNLLGENNGNESQG